MLKVLVINEKLESHTVAEKKGRSDRRNRKRRQILMLYF